MGGPGPPRPEGPPTEGGLSVLERGSGRPLVFLHGYPLHRGMWSNQLVSLADAFRVVLVDLPGFGGSAETEGPDSLEGFASAVAATLDHAIGGPATIVGHSFGGYIALQLYRDRPDLFSTVVLLSTRATADGPEAREKRLATARRLDDPNERLDVEATVRGLLAPSTFARGGPVVAAVREIVSSARNGAVTQALRAMAGRPDLTGVLGSIDVPALVVWGSDDQLIPVEQTRSLVPAISGARGFEVSGAGHLSPMESPSEFDAEVRRFLSGPSADATG